MTPSSVLSNRYLRIGLVAVVLLVVLLVVLAPATGQKTSGSTYNRAPEGYLGWYRYMEAHATPVQRWRRPLTDLLEQTADAPQTLLRIYPGITSHYLAWDQDWLNAWTSAGNTVIALGIDAPVSDAPFSTRQDSSYGDVVIKTRRRQFATSESTHPILEDEYGAIVWQRLQTTFNDAGSVFIALTPHLAANAYLNEPGNYAFLADLVTQAGGPIWVDEYLHGYKAADVFVEETIASWGDYLARTPLSIAVIQAVILLAIAWLAHNRRLGNLAALKAPSVDNSRAYIGALAAVLHKANSTSFLVNAIAKAERTSLQKALGLGDAEVEDTVLAAAWTQQTGQSSQRLEALLSPPAQAVRQTDHTINTWLDQLRQIRQTPVR